MSNKEKHPIRDNNNIEKRTDRTSHDFGEKSKVTKVESPEPWPGPPKPKEKK